MLTGKQKRYLRSKAHHLTPLFQIGKSGLTEPILDQIDEALEARELLKVSVLQNCEEDKTEIADTIGAFKGIEVVQTIGSTIVLYRESKEKKRIQLP
ncbi:MULTISPECIES: ribosome assembly RNA-binding protein YhbY [Sporosarcina]|uniref:ribosome assembly RNA-binding protein YhbY n=1 Tax=Sporosarcina TaxID=1569 RepID=UPI00129B6D25|nr:MULTISPECIES: ribosome assembly RNA-binding protein YhbY [Sporosarcina]GKV66751.1 putative RNA-binding protein YqeI [Sporosarcina sp. NCCP-2331]GLB57066.1 putative RNA-binding protein YqeI [Sporosarcina sp. NCCP-2378]